MTEYLIAFNDDWVPAHTAEELREKAKVTTVDVADREAARRSAGKLAVACGWPREVRRFGVRHNFRGLLNGVTAGLPAARRRGLWR